jgi:hypothetical protein
VTRSAWRFHLSVPPLSIDYEQAACGSSATLETDLHVRFIPNILPLDGTGVVYNQKLILFCLNVRQRVDAQLQQSLSGRGRPKTPKFIHRSVSDLAGSGYRVIIAEVDQALGNALLSSTRTRLGADRCSDGTRNAGPRR